jgi:tetratricopeptide (TPR) repeat protein
MVCSLLTGAALAAGPDDQFVDIYNQILQGQSMEAAGQTTGAAEHYRDSLASLRQLQTDHPSWNPQVVKFRVEFLEGKMAELGKYLPATAPVAAPAPAAPAPADPTASLRAQVDALNASNAQLQQKLKEALSVQPASANPEELAKAQARIDDLQKENDLLKVTLQQKKPATPAPAAPSTAPSEVLKLTDQLTAATNRLAELAASDAALEQKLADANSQINTMKAAPAPAPRTEEMQKLVEERDHLKSTLEQRTRDLADAEAHSSQLKDQAAQVQASTAAQDESSRLGQEVERLRARLAVAEATPVPYTAEELAIMKQAPATPPAQAAPPVAVTTPPASAKAATPAKPGVAHTLKDLPPGAGALMADASRAAMERDFKGAEEKYNEILSQDENNVYVLAHLASAQFEANDLAGCEKSVTHALALDRDDPASLYLLGILRYRQEKLDEALDALSRSALANPTNAGTQNYLGCVLADKGQRPAAETAFRKALQVDPEYADAHFNLAFVYATEKPPSLELARWHYKRATDLHHPKSEELEKLLNAGK